MLQNTLQQLSAYKLGFMGAIFLSKGKANLNKRDISAIFNLFQKLDTRRWNQAFYFYLKISGSTVYRL